MSRSITLAIIALLIQVFVSPAACAAQNGTDSAPTSPPIAPADDGDAANRPAPTAPPPGVPAPGTDQPTPAFDESVAAVAAASQLFAEMESAYREAPAIRDHVHVELYAVDASPAAAGGAPAGAVAGGGGAPPAAPAGHGGRTLAREFDIPGIFSTSGVRLTMGEITMIAIDGTFYATDSSHPDRICIQDFDGPITSDMFVNGLGIFPVMQLPILFDDDPLENLFLPVAFDNRIVGRREIKDPKTGAELTQIRIESSTDGAPLTVTIDPQTRLLHGFESRIQYLGNNTQQGLDVVATMSPERLDRFPYVEFAVDTSGKTKVDSIGGLTGPPSTLDLIGKPAPTFTFDNLDKQQITSDDVRGSVVVLCFWSLESEALQPVTQPLHQLESFAADHKWPVKFIMVDTMNRPEDLKIWLDRDPHDKLTKTNIWIDETGDAAIKVFQAPILPTIVFIGHDGVIVDALSPTAPLTHPLERFKSLLQKTVDHDGR